MATDGLLLLLVSLTTILCNVVQTIVAIWTVFRRK